METDADDVAVTELLEVVVAEDAEGDPAGRSEDGVEVPEEELVDDVVLLTVELAVAVEDVETALF